MNFAWGSNKNRQLGTPNSKKFLIKPEPITISSNLIDISNSGINQTAFLNEKGSLYITDIGKFKIPKAIQISSGYEHFVIRTSSGKCYGIGNNYDGQLGFEEKWLSKEPLLIPLPSKCKYISCGKFTTFFLLETNELFVCGRNENGQCGINEEDKYIFDPELLMKDVLRIWNGGHHAFIYNEKGDVYGIGTNFHGELSLKSSFDIIKTPKKLKKCRPIWEIACGYKHSVLLTQKGNIRVCGLGIYSGLGITEDLFKWKRLKIIPKCINISASSTHSLALCENSIWSWGENLFGQCGSGDFKECKIPIKIEIPQGLFWGDLNSKVLCGESKTSFYFSSKLSNLQLNLLEIRGINCDFFLNNKIPCHLDLLKIRLPEYLDLDTNWDRDLNSILYWVYSGIIDFFSKEILEDLGINEEVILKRTGLNGLLVNLKELIGKGDFKIYSFPENIKIKIHKFILLARTNINFNNIPKANFDTWINVLNWLYLGNGIINKNIIILLKELNFKENLILKKEEEVGDQCIIY